MPQYSFRPMTRADLPMFKEWLANDHIAGWWGDPGTEARLVEEDMAEDKVDMRVALCDGAPFAYIQDYNAHAFDAPHYVDQDKDARAIDTFLGDPAFLGQGHGAGYIAARLTELRRSYPTVLTDPDPRNTRAIAAYTRAGFRPLDIRPCEDGDPVQVMIHP
ncbi:GNAT family N-acetyltransferase [Shimia ponticola]|uniref:GNAT family N-acetyltransferase n=1 Tax=Shimia ponticola TaxID=2582893 RepID=UPI0011BE1F31|nr:GNAT family N-acetyltransferase [Shimia ponticola]